jgi:hypothetical protein
MTPIWDKVYIDTVDSTPPPRLLSFLTQTPYLHTTSGFSNSSEHRKYINSNWGLSISGSLTSTTQPSGIMMALNRLRKCKESIRLLPNEEDSWREWPESAKQSEVLDWLSKVINVVRDISQRRKRASPNVSLYGQPLQGPTADRKLGAAFVRSSNVNNLTWYH